MEGSEFDIETDMIIAAIGQKPDLSLVRDSDISQTPWGSLKVDRVTMQTSKEGVFAVGDCVTGPATAIEAIGAGQRAAVAVDRYLGGKGKLPPHTHYARAEQPEPLPEGVAPPPRSRVRSPRKRFGLTARARSCRGTRAERSP